MSSSLMCLESFFQTFRPAPGDCSLYRPYVFTFFCFIWVFFLYFPNSFLFARSVSLATIAQKDAKTEIILIIRTIKYDKNKLKVLYRD